MKESFYFTHDYNASQDEKLRKLIRCSKMEGYGIYWRLIEMLYQETEKYKLKKDYEGIADDLRTNSERIKEVVENFELFQFDDTCFWSETVLKRVKSREEKSESARKSAEARWNKSGKGKNANAMRGKKVAMLKRRGEEKENREEDIKEKIEKEKSPIILFFESEDQQKELALSLSEKKKISLQEAAGHISDFVAYWTERTKDGKKQKWELQDTFEVPKRLSTWFKNTSKFSPKAPDFKIY